MHYMVGNRALRIDTASKLLMQNTACVVVAAFPYGEGAESGGVWRYVAGHARGRDYHKTLKARLTLIAAEIKCRYPTLAHRVFVDSAPIMERTAAVMARIGDIGKSGALLVPGWGPAVLLGTIFCSGVPCPPAEAPPPQDFRVCGGCRRCMESCPTSAIVAPGVVDAHRCLSYWSIEARSGDLPDRISAALSGIFGCDRCTQSCPLSRTEDCALENAPGRRPLPADLSDFLDADDAVLKEILSGTALARTGVPALKRNARAVLINERRKR